VKFSLLWEKNGVSLFKPIFREIVWPQEKKSEGEKMIEAKNGKIRSIFLSLRVKK
jgi:hypothetical protein